MSFILGFVSAWICLLILMAVDWHEPRGYDDAEIEELLELMAEHDVETWEAALRGARTNS